MKKTKFLLLAAILTLTLGFIACGGSGSGGGGGSTGPDPYVKFEAFSGPSPTLQYSSGTAGWIGGVSDAGYGSEPISSLLTSNGRVYSCGIKTTTAGSSFNRDTVDHVYIITLDNSVKTFNSSDCNVQIRINGQNGTGSPAFWLTSESVTITHYDSVYVEGTFSGNDPNGWGVTGSFLFTNVGNDNWPIPYY